jgi:hypothetical protein
MAGHNAAPRGQQAEMPVDYNDGERPYLLTKEFSSHHRTFPFFF